MAGPVTHTILAEKALKTLFTSKNHKEFIIGSLFPDIRCLGVIDRDDSHFRGLSLENIHDEPDSFRAGLMFHSLVDEKREKFVVGKEVYSSLPDSYLSTVALKICEDIKLYPMSDRWEQYSAYLSDILPQEKAFGIATESLRAWHDIHIRLLSNPPFEYINDHLAKLGLSEAQVAEILRLVEVTNELGIVEGYAGQLYGDLEKILQ